MTPTIIKEIAGQARVFKFTFKTMHVLLSKFPDFDSLSPFEQLPAFVYAGLIAGNELELSTLSFDDFEENYLFTMTEEDMGDVMAAAKEAMGFLGSAMGRVNENGAQKQKPKGARR